MEKTLAFAKKARLLGGWGASKIYPERMVYNPMVWLQQIVSHTDRSLILDNDTNTSFCGIASR